jgi:hypothetical protein
MHFLHGTRNISVSSVAVLLPCSSRRRCDQHQRPSTRLRGCRGYPASRRADHQSLRGGVSFVDSFSCGPSLLRFSARRSSPAAAPTSPCVGSDAPTAIDSSTAQPTPTHTRDASEQGSVGLQLEMHLVLYSPVLWLLTMVVSNGSVCSVSSPVFPLGLTMTWRSCSAHSFQSG